MAQSQQVQKKSQEKEQIPRSSQQQEIQQNKNNIDQIQFQDNEEFIQQQAEQIFQGYVNREQLDLNQNVQLDSNYNYKNVFLGKEGQFKDYNILIGEFYTIWGFHLTALKELQRTGFSYQVVKSVDEFIQKLPACDIAWFISSSTIDEKLSQKFQEAIGKHMSQKKSLFIWADNTPFTAHADVVLTKYFDGMYLKGDYQGNQIIYGDDKAQKQKFDVNHAISYGLNNLHEGITICHPEKMHKDFEIFAYNSNDEPLVLFSEENKNHGRILVDFGFTKLYSDYWNLAGTHQYVANCSVWLTGVVQ